MLGDGAADVGAVDGVGLVRDGLGVTVGVLVGVLVAVGAVLLGAGVGSLWLQATGPTIQAATNTAVMTGRRMLLLGSVGPAAWGVGSRRRVPRAAVAASLGRYPRLSGPRGGDPVLGSRRPRRGGVDGGTFGAQVSGQPRLLSPARSPAGTVRAVRPERVALRGPNLRHRAQESQAAWAS